MRARKDTPGTGGDSGFTLVETLVAAVLIASLVVVTTTVAIGAVGSLARLHHQQAAARLATQVLETARSLSPVPDGSGCTALLAGRTATTVAPSLTTYASVLDLTGFDPAYAETSCTTQSGLPIYGTLYQGVTRSNPVQLDGEGYTVVSVVGTCQLLSTGGCVKSALVGTSAVGQSLYRVTALVQWSEPRCPAGTCSYSVSTLVDASTDVSFSARSPYPSAPTNVAATVATNATAVTWAAPVRSGDSAISQYRATAALADGTVVSSCTVTGTTLGCTIPNLLNGETYRVTVTASNTYGAGAPSNAVTVIPVPALLLDTSRLRLWLDGADAATLQTDCLTRATATTVVGCWKDKSPQQNDASQVLATAQPTLSKVAGRLVPTFDGAADYLDLVANKLPTGTASGSAFTVAQLADPVLTQGSHRSVLNYGTVAGGAEREIQKEASTSKVRVTVGGAGILLNSQWSLTRPTVVGATWTATQLTSSVDGAASASLGGVSYSTGTGYAHIGAFGSTSLGQFWYGTVPEVVVISGVATAQEQQDMAEYLGRKWQTQTVPNPPTGVGATAAGSTVTVSWTAPVWTGSTPVTSYTAALTSGESCTTTGTSCTLTRSGAVGLTVTVTAANAVGTSRTGSAVVR